MSEKMFTNEQALDHLNYAVTCGYSLEKFIYGRGLYGNRVSLVRAKDPRKLYTKDSDFKNSNFHIIEGKKALEQTQTILINRQQLEAPLTDKECMRDFLEGANVKFLSEEDKERVLSNWAVVGRKLLSSSSTDFAKLNNYVLGHVVLDLPISAQMIIAEFRKSQILALLTQDIIPATFAKKCLDLLPDSKEDLVALKQKLIKQRDDAIKAKMQAKQAEVVSVKLENVQFEPVSKTIQSTFSNELFKKYDVEKEKVSG